VDYLSCNEGPCGTGLMSSSSGRCPRRARFAWPAASVVVNTIFTIFSAADEPWAPAGGGVVSYVCRSGRVG
jgi:hypothetical protein